MRSQATGTIEMKTWDEHPYQEFEGGRKLTRASVTNAFHGDIEGESAVEYLMAYPSDNIASFVGLERVVGRAGNRSGSFVLQHSGSYDSGAVSGTWSVVPDSGTGDLQGLRGQGQYEWDGQVMRYTLDYEVD